MYSLSVISQEKKLIAIDTLENSHVLKMYGSYENEKLTNEYHYLFDENGRKLYSRKYRYGFDCYIGAEFFSITKEKITRRGKKLGIKRLKLKSGHCKKDTYSVQYTTENSDAKTIDTIASSRLMYEVKSDSLKWAVWKDSVIYEPITETYKFDSILIYKLFVNNELRVVSYSYPFSCEEIKSIDLDSNGNIIAMKMNRFHRDKVFIKKEYEYYFDYNANEITIYKSKFNFFGNYKTNSKTTPIEEQQ